MPIAATLRAVGQITRKAQRGWRAVTSSHRNRRFDRKNPQRPHQGGCVQEVWVDGMSRKTDYWQRKTMTFAQHERWNAGPILRFAEQHGGNFHALIQVAVHRKDKRSGEITFSLGPPPYAVVRLEYSRGRIHALKAYSAADRLAAQFHELKIPELPFMKKVSRMLGLPPVTHEMLERNQTRIQEWQASRREILARRDFIDGLQNNPGRWLWVESEAGVGNAAGQWLLERTEARRPRSMAFSEAIMVETGKMLSQPSAENGQEILRTAGLNTKLAVIFYDPNLQQTTVGVFNHVSAIAQIREFLEWKKEQFAQNTEFKAALQIRLIGSNSYNSCRLIHEMMPLLDSEYFQIVERDLFYGKGHYGLLVEGATGIVKDMGTK